MEVIPNNFPVIVISETGQIFKGTVVNSGTQAKVLMYAVLLNEPTYYPNIETGVSIVEVPYNRLYVDNAALNTLRGKT
jgi:hypothetical protein